KEKSCFVRSATESWRSWSASLPGMDGAGTAETVGTVSRPATDRGSAELKVEDQRQVVGGPPREVGMDDSRMPDMDGVAGERLVEEAHGVVGGERAEPSHGSRSLA